MSRHNDVVFGFGILLSKGRCEQILDKLGIEWEYDTGHVLAEKYGLQCQETGSWPDVADDPCNAISYLIGPKHKSHVEFGGPNSVAQINIDINGGYSLSAMLQ
ncbi:MAG: hypothetical protein ACXABY_23450, partial [Candidatus Thorarchaeota archaeon]